MIALSLNLNADRSLHDTIAAVKEFYVITDLLWKLLRNIELFERLVLNLKLCL